MYVYYAQQTQDIEPMLAYRLPIVFAAAQHKPSIGSMSRVLYNVYRLI